MERLAQVGAAQRIVVLDAPAGFGKTSLLLAWQHALVGAGTDVAWLDVAADATPERFCKDLLAALAKVKIASKTRHVCGDDEAQLERTVIAIVRALAAHARPVLLIVDDAQHARDPRIRQMIQLLFEYAPIHFHGAFATRGGALPLPLARERAAGQVLDIGREDLRFSREETAGYLQASLPRVDTHTVDTLHELSEGWGSLLALLASGWRQRAAGDAGAFADMHSLAPVSAFFDAEVFAHLSRGELQALEAWSVPSQLRRSLCAALAPPGVPRGAVAVMLERMVDAGLLRPVPPQPSQTWLRMHPLARLLLHLRLQMRSDEGRLHLHAIAWRWFADHEFHQEAVRHALLAGDEEAAAAWVEQHARPLFARGEIPALVALVRQLPESVRASRPALHFWSAWIALSERRFDDCEKLLQALEAESAGQPVPLFRLALLRSLAGVLHDDTNAALRHMDQLLHPPEGADPIAVAGRRNVLSWLYLQLGEHERARAIQFEEPAPLIDGEPIIGTIFGSLMGRTLVGMSYAAQGDMHCAEEQYRAVLAEATTRGDCSEAASLAQQMLLDVSYEREGPAEAARQLAVDMKSGRKLPLIPDAALRVVLVRSRAHLQAGRSREALQALTRALESATRLELDREVAYLLLDALKVHLSLGDADAARACLLQLDRLDTKQAAHPHGTPRDIGILARRGHVRMAMHEGRLRDAREQLEALIAQASNRGLHRRLVYLLVQAAGVAKDQGDRPAATAFMHAALPVAHRLGLMQVLLDAHPNAPALLRELARTPGLDERLVFHIERIEALLRREARGGALQASDVATEVDRLLTPREAEVVALLRQGMPNKRIARALGLSLDTVKWHLKNVFLKLNVHGREDAILRLGEHAGE